MATDYFRLYFRFQFPKNCQTRELQLHQQLQFSEMSIALCRTSQPAGVFGKAAPKFSPNLAVQTSDTDGKQLYEEILDCKLLVSSRAT